MGGRASGLDEVVGVRFEPRGALVWFRAGGVAGAIGDWVVGERDGQATVGQVVVGRGQCLAFAGRVELLPELMRDAVGEEVPRARQGAGRRLLESLG